MVLFRRHGLCKSIRFRKDIAPLSVSLRESEGSPFLPGPFPLQDVDIEIRELGIVEIEVGRAVGVFMP